MDRLAAIIDRTYVPAVQKQIELNESGFSFVDMMKRELKAGEQLTFEEIYDNTIILIVAVGSSSFFIPRFPYSID